MNIQKQGDELLVLMGSMVREKRLERGLSLKELAGKADIKVNLLSEIEEGRKGMSIEIFFKIKQALDVSFGFLFGED
ncbi:MAG: helix-turn-helix domain-containing protein [Oscillospiraceae bacterium]|nr:helix-turn-helix domain-containing protein [Oscillospiraceae bacterium]